MLETDALKEKLEMEIHRFARPPEELSSGDPYFEQLQTMLAIRDELINIPLCDIQRNMLLSMENVLESAWSFRNTPVPDRCMNPNNISEVVYYFLQDKGAEYRGDLLYERAKAEFDARMEERRIAHAGDNPLLLITELEAMAEAVSNGESTAHTDGQVLGVERRRPA